jgi:hypothetical protein
VLRGDKPSLLPKTLLRIMVNTVPKLSGGAFAQAGSSDGCCPEIQLLQSGRLLWCSSRHAGTTRKFCPSDGCMSFPVEIDVTADVVLRCSHVHHLAAPDGDQQPTLDAVAASPVVAASSEAESEAAQPPTDDHPSRHNKQALASTANANADTVVERRIPMWRTAFNVGYVQAGILVRMMLHTTHPL